MDLTAGYIPILSTWADISIHLGVGLFAAELGAALRKARSLGLVWSSGWPFAVDHLLFELDALGDS